ncbi:Protein ral2 [Yarrowia sp. C11]|nr:Protein ral2 [Yarrowia sp. C11]KAG5364819.1 Protein ral2 [Yarrowia sp. E02]
MALVKRITEYRPRHAAVAEIPDPPSTSHKFSNNFVSTQYLMTRTSPTRPYHKLETDSQVSSDELKEWSFYDVSYVNKDEAIRPPSPPCDTTKRTTPTKPTAINTSTTNTTNYGHSSRTNSMGSRSVSSTEDANSLYSHPLTRHTSVTSSTSVSPNNHQYYKQSLPPLPSDSNSKTNSGASSDDQERDPPSRPASVSTSFASFPRPQQLSELATSLARAPAMSSTSAIEQQPESPTAAELLEPCIPPMVPYAYHPRIYGSSTPPQVYGHSSTTVGAKVYSFGGTNGSACNNDMHCFNTDAHVLKKIDRSVKPAIQRTVPRPIYRRRSFNQTETNGPAVSPNTPALVTPSPRKFHTGTTKYIAPVPGVPKRHGGVDIFYFGGGDDTQCFNDAFLFDTRTHLFRKVADGENDKRPAPRQGHVTINSGDYFYVHGGHNPFTGQIFNDMWRFDTATNKWAEVEYQNAGEAHPAAAYHDGCFCEREGYFLFYGGRFEDGTVCSQMTRFYPKTASWASVPVFIYNKLTGQGMRVSLGRFGHKIMNGGKWVYILGGDNGDGQVTDMWVFSLSTGVMIRSCYYGVLLKGLSHHTTAFCDGRLYFFGGLNTAAERPEVVCEIRCIELPLSGTCMKEED